VGTVGACTGKQYNLEVRTGDGVTP
jgi:hypothetical protein